MRFTSSAIDYSRNPADFYRKTDGRKNGGESIGSAEREEKRKIGEPL
jgi:hypothetical protein